MQKKGDLVILIYNSEINIHPEHMDKRREDKISKMTAVRRLGG